MKAKNIVKYSIQYNEVIELEFWRDEIGANIKKNMALLPIAVPGMSLMLKILGNGDGRATLFKGPGVIARHQWPNMETKQVVLFDDKAKGENDFWLNYYPFLFFDEKCKHFRLRGDIKVNELTCPEAQSSNYIICSHNGHLGHFIADDLPWMIAFGASLSVNRLFTCASVSESIRKEIQFIKVDYFESSHYDGGKSYALRCPQVIHGWIYDWALRSFFVRKYIHSQEVCTAPNNSHMSSKEKLLFIARSKEYGTRIANYEVLSEMLNQLGFEACTLDGLSLKETATVMVNSKLIVAESGTTSLIASVCSRIDTSIISLQPRSIFTSPTLDMVESGLPYISFFHPRISYFLGHEEVCHSIQSSSRSTYSVDELRNYILEKLDKLKPSL